MKDKKPCQNCRNNFYNGNNDIGVKQCWSLEDAKLVRRWKLNWWISPAQPGAFQEVETYHLPSRARKVCIL